MRTRNWSIRAKIISLLLVPLVTLIAMWGLATAVTLGPGLELLDAQDNIDNIGRPVQTVVDQLQQERRLTLVYMATGRRDPTGVAAQRMHTDAAVADFRQASAAPRTRDAATELTVQRLGELGSVLDSMTQLREGVDRGEVDRNGVMRLYTEVVDSAFLVYGSLIRVSDESLTRQSRALVGFSRASELLAQEDAAITAAAAAGGFAPGDLSQTVQLIGAQRFLFSDTLPDLNPADGDEYARMVATDAFVRLAQLENTLLVDARAGAPVPFPSATWRSTYDTVAAALKQFAQQATATLIDRTSPAAVTIFGKIAAAGVLGLLAVIITLVASIRIGRSILKRLAGLRQAALELAIDRLPRVVHRLRRSEPVDVSQEAPALPYGDDEIGQVGHAFNELQRTAVTSAIEEANVRRGLNEVFLNIARRSQTLLHRQLTVLDRMERRTEDPVELEDLFRVDHLATRMRRHAEDLVILAGAAPGRGWRNPVPMVDVLRGAVSEVEDYARVSIRPMPEISLAGRAVGDVIHLLAELIENSTSFSPPHTRVNIGGEFVTHGFAIEIEDRGLGMSAEALAEANERLTHPPDFDPSNSAQLGLFVVARLAARHDVKVQLRSSPYGGVTAVALVPDELIIAEAGPATGRIGTPRPRDVAALPSAPGGVESNGRPGSRYHELPTGQRPAIAPPPAAGHTGQGHTAEAQVAEGRTIPRHARQEYIEAPTSAGPDGLPRRIRQSSLSPQLRHDHAPTIDEVAQMGPGARSPEQTRTMMSSFQAGLERGRRDADRYEADTVDDETTWTTERDAR